ncbi:hypothetical protein ACIO7M_32125 [Streptomyces toxytricini]|uniref:Lipoprotein n=2 Tax=Streptomyces toxytricini TaxID=67369 RepID=A0ABW8ERH5_STRT5
MAMVKAIQDIRAARAAARLIGRRNALRYLALGAGAALAAACTGKGAGAAGADGKGAGPAPAGSTPPAPTPSTAAPSAPSGTAGPATGSAAAAPTATTAGVLARAFDAFVKGRWRLESTTPGGPTVTGTATVLADGGGNGGFTIDWDGPDGKPVTWTGSWLLRGGHLRTDVHTAPKGINRLTGGEALTVPKEVGEGASLLLPWKPPGHKDTGDGQQLQVTYRDGVLRITHRERGGSESVHTCTRLPA